MSFFEFPKKLPSAAGKNAYFPLPIHTPQGSRTFWWAFSSSHTASRWVDPHIAFLIITVSWGFSYQFPGRVFKGTTDEAWQSEFQKWVFPFDFFTQYLQSSTCLEHHRHNPINTFLLSANLLWRIFTWFLKYHQLWWWSLRPEKTTFLFHQHLNHCA